MPTGPTTGKAADHPAGLVDTVLNRLTVEQPQAVEPDGLGTLAQVERDGYGLRRLGQRPRQNAPLRDLVRGTVGLVPENAE